MYDLKPSSLTEGYSGPHRPGVPADYRLGAWLQGRHVFNNLLWEGRFRRLLRLLARRTFDLYDLNRLGCSGCEQHYVGVQTVPVHRIVGSEGRCRDFDRRFRPLGIHTRDRWISVYTAMYLGVELPPVVLVEAREHYFVRDGHHRISVAVARGQRDVDAEVTRWEVTGRMPWEPGERPIAIGQIGTGLCLASAAGPAAL